MRDILNEEKLLKLYPDFDKVYWSVNREPRRVVLLYSLKKRTSISYARALMEVKLGRRLLDTEEVDHKDNDKMNDVIGNLQILTKTQNRNKTTRLPLVVCKCTKEFKPVRRTQKFCSNICRYRYTKTH